MDAKRILPIALIYFFVNSVGLPEGLLYTYFLTPLFVFWLIQNNYFKELIVVSILLGSFALIHLIQGVDSRYSYMLSFINLFLSIVTSIAAYRFFKTSKNNFALFSPIILLNFLLTLVSFAFLFLGDLKEVFWYTKPIFNGAADIPRLKMFTYEASYYSFILAPFVVFAVTSVFTSKLKTALPILVMVLIPLCLSFSFGVMAALALSFPLVLLFITLKKGDQTIQLKKAWILLFGVLALILLVFLIWPQMILFQRTDHILKGADTSGRGRTTESFWLAWDLIKNKDYWFGIGLGQSKIMGRQLMEQFYGIYDQAVVFRIPNSMAETLATFGIVGVAIKLFLQGVLFFKCRVYKYFSSVWLFLFLFIYQFTGSYLTNLAEWVLWAIVFSNLLGKIKLNESKE